VRCDLGHSPVESATAGDEYLTKPVDQTALVARIKSVLRLKALHDQVQAQATELAEINRNLERRVAEQVVTIERTSRLKRFLAPPVSAFNVRAIKCDN
jgi:adenylate cyclase